MRESGIILVVSEAEPLVGAIRHEHDRVARLGVPAHITLLYPWVTPPIDEAAVQRLRAAVDRAAPYEIVFRGIGRFERALYLRPDDDGQTLDLAGRIAAFFPDYPPYGGRFASPVPHLTVAEVEESLEPIIHTCGPALLAGLPLAATVTSVTVMESGDDGLWSVRATVPLLAV